MSCSLAVIFSSQHGRTRKVVREVERSLALDGAVFDVAAPPSAELLLQHDLLTFFTPTYGDEELHEDMERFIEAFDSSLDGRRFAVCELGNYGGYDDFSFGALHILRTRLFQLGGVELCPPLSLESLPRLDWNQLSRWIEVLKGEIPRHDGL